MNNVKKAPRLPALVAHRGYTRHYPENTLPACEAALGAGARYVEVDVQLTADGVPVLFHDLELRRTTGAAGRITGIPFDALEKLSAGETERLGPRFRDTQVPALSALVDQLQAWRDVHAFIELKPESMQVFGLETVVAKVMAIIPPIAGRSTLISFDREAMRYARSLGARSIGWVLTAYSEEMLAKARSEAPDYLFCNYTKVPTDDSPLWVGPWRWVVYEITDASVALALAARGAALIETMAVGEILQDPLWRDNTGRGG
ncbi:MAG TPA: glycerophosphodiester phosphodiesterase family protein [Candidatus Binatia bacterium]